MKKSIVLISFLICVFTVAAGKPVLARQRLRDPALCKMVDYDEEGMLDEDRLQEKRAKVEERLEMMMMWQLSDKLDLSEKTGAKFFPLVKRFQREQRKIIARQRDIKKLLRKALKKGRDEKLKGLLEDLKDNTRELVKLREREYEELKTVLSIRQLAEYILFRDRFNREVRDIVAETRHRRQYRGGRDSRRKFDEEKYADD
jgi:arsenate reductase-like glutaredoxin family protein